MMNNLIVDEFDQILDMPETVCIRLIRVEDRILECSFAVGSPSNSDGFFTKWHKLAYGGSGRKMPKLVGVEDGW